MKYLTQKHEKGLAIISWCIDEDYENSSPYMHHLPDCVYYMLYIEVYDIDGNLVHEDGIGGIDVSEREGSDEFKQSILNSYEFHFTTATVA